MKNKKLKLTTNFKVMNKIIKKYWYLGVLSIIAISTSSYAQPKTNQYNQEVTVVAPYKPTVSDAFKINENPIVTDTLTEKPISTYSIYSVIIPSKIETTPIEAAKVVGEPIEKLYGNLIKVGFGNYITPYVELFANTLRSKKFSLGGHFLHLSSSGKFDGYAYPGISNNHFDLYGKKFWKNYTFNSEVAYHRNAYHYYGFKTSDFADSLLPSNKDIKQVYNIISANISFGSNYTDSNHLNNSYRINYFSLFDNHSVSEHNIKFNTSLFKSFSFIKLTKHQTIGADLDIDFFNDKNDSATYNNAIIAIEPFIATSFGVFDLSVGFNTTFEIDIESSLHFYPVAELKIDIIENILDANIGINGSLQKNSLYSFSKENPYINTILPLESTNEKINFYGGVRSNIANILGLAVNASVKVIDNMPLFVTDTSNIFKNKYTVAYDKVTWVRVGAELNLLKINSFSLLLNGNYNYYTLDKEAKAWNKPDVDITLSAGYNFKNKLLFHLDFFTYINRYGKTFSGSTVVAQKLSNIFDINFGIEYRYNKKLSAFINTYNIASSRYDKWYSYPSYKFSLIGGLTFAF